MKKVSAAQVKAKQGNVMVPPPSTLNVGGFRYTLKNATQKEATYHCLHAKDSECKTVLVYQRDVKTGKVREELPPVVRGQHERSCTVKNKVQNSYEARMLSEEKKSDPWVVMWILLFRSFWVVYAVEIRFTPSMRQLT